MEEEEVQEQKKTVQIGSVTEFQDLNLHIRQNKCQELFNWVPKRLWVAIMCFLTMAIYYMLFSSFNVMLTQMVSTDTEEKLQVCGPKALKEKKENVSQIHFLVIFLNGGFLKTGPQYAWDDLVQLQMICAFHVGQVFTTIPGGILAEKVGARYMVGIGLICVGIANLLIPASAEGGTNSVNILRLIQGFLCGQIYPAMQCTFARWAPPTEKSKFVWTLFGSMFGVTFSTLLCSAVLKATHFWPAVFYIIGTISIIWAALWIYIIRDFPEKHPSISNHELQYIRKSIGPTVMPEFTMIQVHKVLASRRYWALFTAQFAYYHAHLILVSLAPKYHSEVLGLSMNSFQVVIPTIIEGVAGLTFCVIGDALRSKKILHVTTIRKSFSIISHFATGIVLIGNAYAGCRKTLAFILQVVAAACIGASAVTNLTNVHDLAPNHAGTVDGMIIFVPIITSVIVRIASGYGFKQEENYLKQWKVILSSTGYLYVFGGIVFSIWASGKIQIWNFPADFHFPNQTTNVTFLNRSLTSEQQSENPTQSSD